MYTYPEEWFVLLTDQLATQFLATAIMLAIVSGLSLIMIQTITQTWLARPAFKTLTTEIFYTPWAKRLNRFENIIAGIALLLFMSSQLIDSFNLAIIYQLLLIIFTLSVLTRNILTSRYTWQTRHQPELLAALTTSERRQWHYFNIWSIIEVGLIMLVQATTYIAGIGLFPYYKIFTTGTY